MTTASGPVGERQRAILRALADAGDCGLFPRDFAALYDPERLLEYRLNNVRNNLRSLSMRGLVAHSEDLVGRNGYCWRITRKGLDWLLSPGERWTALREEIQRDRDIHYERACDLADEGKDGDERAFGRVEAYDELLATMDRMEAGQ